MKIFKRIVLAFAFFLGIVACGLFLYSRGKYVVPILVYHHVDYIPKGELCLNNVSPASFEKQMAYIHDHDYHPLRLFDLVDKIKKGEPIPPKSVVVTFDDGYEDNYNYAYPILKKYEIPASIFLVTDIVGNPGYLTWDQIKEMMGHGVFFGSHTRTHAYLPDLNTQQLQDEIAESRKILHDKLDIPVNLFAYPVGGFNEEAKQIVKEAGYLGAVTTNRGNDRFNKDVYELKRIRMKDADTYSFVLWAKLSGYYNLFRSSKNSN